MWLYLLIGFAISQLICFVVFVLTHENEEKTMLTGGGLFFLPTKMILALIRTIKKWYINRTYIVVQVCGITGNFWNQYVRLKRKWFDNYYHKGENEYFIEEYLKRKGNISNYDNIRKIPANGWWNNDWINKNLLKKS